MGVSDFVLICYFNQIESLSGFASLLRCARNDNIVLYTVLLALSLRSHSSTSLTAGEAILSMLPPRQSHSQMLLTGPLSVCLQLFQ
jgi:hypothetical protein